MTEDFAAELIHRKVSQALNRLKDDLFVPELELTLIGRLPGNNEADILMTSDDLQEVKSLVERSIKRESRDPNSPPC